MQTFLSLIKSCHAVTSACPQVNESEFFHWRHNVKVVAITTTSISIIIFIQEIRDSVLQAVKQCRIINSVANKPSAVTLIPLRFSVYILLLMNFGCHSHYFQVMTLLATWRQWKRSIVKVVPCSCIPHSDYISVELALSAFMNMRSNSRSWIVNTSGQVLIT